MVKPSTPLFRLLQLSAFGVFVGRGWQHLFWDAPFRALLWDEKWIKWLVSGLLGWDWQWFLTSQEGNHLIDSLVKGVGVLYVLAALAVFFLPYIPRWSKILLFLGGINLVWLAGLYTKEHFWQWGQFLEYTLQFSAPFALWKYYQAGGFSRKTIILLKIAVALTFSCHGLYAIGYYPRPGSFVQMTISILGLTEPQALIFLMLAGSLDFIVSGTIFLPGKAGSLVLGYAFFWGLATSLARIAAHLHPDFWIYTMNRWMPEVFFRFPHFMVPLVLLILKSPGYLIRQNPS